MRILINFFQKKTSSYTQSIMEDVPIAVKDKILPNEGMNILLFLQFQIPTVLGAISAVDPQEYVSPESPTTTAPANILMTPCPPKHIIDSLHNTFIRSEGIQSISCPHIYKAEGKHFPTWIIMYWTQLSHVCNACKKWSTAVAELEKRRQNSQLSEESVRVADEAYDILNQIPWSASIHGFPLKLDITYLSQFMTMEWLTSKHVDMMMDLLQ
jgi:hypothetical protein